MNLLDELRKLFDATSFAWRDLLGLDVWTAFVPVFPVLTIVGTPTYTGRFRFVGRKCEFQAKAVSTVSIASTAGTSYMTLPATAQGLAGGGQMDNITANTTVGNLVINVAAQKCFLPAQAASGNTFTLFGSFEV